MSFAATHIGTATLLLEIGSLRLLTDPVLDAPVRKYGFGFGTRSLHVEQPARLPDSGRIDLVLLSHDHHADNLDDAGRAMLPSIPRVLTTRGGAKRLKHPGAVGLAAFESIWVDDLKVTATPARHGPACSLPIVGEVIGFMLEHETLDSPIYISGDTVWFAGIAEIARRWQPGVSFLHVGAARFPITGPLKYTFDAKEAAIAAQALGSRRVIPVHYEGWTHFSESQVHADQILRGALGDKVQWLERGMRTVIA